MDRNNQSTSPTPSKPFYAAIPGSNLTIGAGAAIFQVATSRVVLCYHSRDKYWFLPKGRKNANETLTAAAEREAFEESGYRNRLLPLPLRHRQTQPDSGPEEFVTEAVWVQMMPVGRGGQYCLFWFVAETLDREGEEEYAEEKGRVYSEPVAFPKGLTLEERMKMDEDREPIRHPGTGVDEDELMYESYLLSIEEACGKLKGSVMEDVVRKGWEGIQLRKEIEARRASS